MTRTIMSVAQRWLVRRAWISCCRLVSSGFMSGSQMSCLMVARKEGEGEGRRGGRGCQVCWPGRLRLRPDWPMPRMASMP